MGLVASIERSLGLVRQARTSRAPLSFVDANPGIEAPHASSYTDLPSAYRVHPWVYAAVRAIAMAGADVPLAAMRVKREVGGKSLWLAVRSYRARGASWPEALVEAKQALGGEDISDHPILRLIQSPFPEAGITEHELKQAILSYLELTGNAYVEKVFADDLRTKVRALWPKIDPRQMWVIPGEETLVAGYIYRAGTRVKVFAENEIIHFSYLHPENPYYGLSPTEVLRAALIADVRAVDWNRMFFENDATPGLVLQTDQHLDPSQADAVRERWRDRYQGVQKSHRIAVLSDGLKVQPLSPTHTDMAFLEQRSWTRDEILAVYGVPPIIVGIYKDTNRASAQTMRRLFYEQCVIPRLGKLEATLNAALVPKGEPIVLYFDLSSIEALHEQTEDKALTGRMLLSQGWTLGELRRWWGLPPATGAGINTVWAPTVVQPAGEAEETPSKGSKKATGDIVKRAVDVPLVGDPLDYLPPATPEVQAVIHLRHLPKIGMEGSLWAAEHLAEIGVELPSDWQNLWGWQERIEEWVRAHTATLVKQIDDVTRAQIAQIIQQGMDDGEGAQAIAKRLRDEFAWMGKTRSETIARTEGTYAVNFGQHELYKQAGIERHRWLATLDGRVRDIHAAAHMQEVAMDEPFVVGGELLRYPGDTSLGASPGNCINCRCAEEAITQAYSPSREVSELLWWKREAWLRGLEMELGAEYRRDLERWFVAEGEHYVAYLLDRAGGLEGRRT